MSNMLFSSNYQRGLAPLIILSLLKTEDMYGYQLVQETERVSNGRIVTQEGSLCPVLYKLEDDTPVTLGVGTSYVAVYNQKGNVAFQ